MSKPHRRGKAAVSGESHSRAKLDWDKVTFIRDNPLGLTNKELGDRFGVAESTIWAVVDDRNWREENRPARSD